MVALIKIRQDNYSTACILPYAAVSLSLGIIISMFVSTAMANDNSKFSSSDLALARDYVLAACVAERYTDTPLAVEANSWAGGLIERGNLPAAAYPALAHLAHGTPKPGINRDGITMRLQNCVDFVNTRDFPTRLRQVLHMAR